MGLLKTLVKYDSILIRMDRLMKSAHFMIVQVDYNSQSLAKIYVKEILRLHGVPLTIISDTDAKYISKFWNMLHKKLGTKLTFGLDFDAQIDG